MSSKHKFLNKWEMCRLLTQLKANNQIINDQRIFLLDFAIRFIAKIRNNKVVILSDLEGLTRNLLSKGYTDQQIIQRLVQEYHDFKEIEDASAVKLAEAILDECRKSDKNLITDSVIKDILDINKSEVTVGKQGVGCRGAGDFFVHKLIAELSETGSKAYLTPVSLDDAGAVNLLDINDNINLSGLKENLFIVSKMEGIHSRLSDFPFICGFHVTRACLRDLP